MTSYSFTHRIIAAAIAAMIVMPLALFSARADGVTLTAVSPNPVAVGKTLKIKGTGFSGPNTVTFSPGGATATGGLLSTYFPIKVPKDLVPGNYTVSVKNKAGQTSTNTLSVKVESGSTGGGNNGGGDSNPPAGSVILTSLSPESFSTHITQSLKLRGSGFAGPNTVEVKEGSVVKKTYTGGLLSTSFNIRIVKGDLAPGVYSVTVKNKHGQVSNAKSLTITNDGPPTVPVRISTIAPASASAQTNQRILMTGSGFLGTNKVHFTGPGSQQNTVTTTGRSLLRTDLNTKLPNSLGAGVYQVSVENANGVSNSVAFTVHPLLQYTAFGDSIASGASAGYGSGYVSRYEKNIETDKNIALTFKRLSRSGSTSSHLVELVKNNAAARTAIGQSRVITWNIGGNDLRAARSKYQGKRCGGVDNQDCLRAATSALKANWTTIVSEMKAVAPSNAVLRTINLYNPYVDEDSAKDSWAQDGGLNDYQVLNMYFVEANNHIMAEAQAHGIPIADIYSKFNGPSGNDDPSDKGYISFDGYHPNSAGHMVIADTLKALGYAPL